jgi:hypothetical protein
MSPDLHPAWNSRAVFGHKTKALITAGVPASLPADQNRFFAVSIRPTIIALW